MLRGSFKISATGLSTGIALTINATDSVWFVLNDQYWADYYAKRNADSRTQGTLSGGTVSVICTRAHDRHTARSRG